jgi:hypothetical protein
MDDPKPHFAQSMKNVSAKVQNFAGIFAQEEFNLTKPAERPINSNSMLNSSFLQGFASRRGQADSNLQV